MFSEFGRAGGQTSLSGMLIIVLYMDVYTAVLLICCLLSKVLFFFFLVLFFLHFKKIAAVIWKSIARAKAGLHDTI